MTPFHAYGSVVQVLQFFTAVWLCGWTIRSLALIARGDARTVLFIQLVHFFFCGIPLILDLAVTPPVYPYQWGFIVSQYDPVTNYVYLAYMAAVPVLFMLFGGRAAPLRARVTDPTTSIHLRPWPRVAAWALLLAMPVTLVLAPRPEMYVDYAAIVERHSVSEDNYHTVIAAVSILAVVAGVLIITARNSTIAQRVSALPLMSLALWLHGKRSVVALAALMFVYLLWMRGTLRGSRFVAASLIAGIALGVFSYSYQTNVRQIGAEPSPQRSLASSEIYVNYRIDFGRDATIKQTLFAELYPEQIQILDYRGQSLLFDVTFMVPRQLWPEKPYPYAVYFTSAMLRSNEQVYGWGMTTSWLEEAVANFGWLGLLIGPLLPARICAAGDRRRAPLMGLLTVCVASLFLVLQLPAFLPIFFAWLFLIARAGRTDRRVTNASLPATPAT